MSGSSGSSDTFDDSLYDPMSYDFLQGFNRLGINEAGGQPSRVKDRPCEFHDGFSGDCWKGRNCSRSHQPFTGGEFVKNNPEVSLAMNFCKEVTSVTDLASKPLLTREAQIQCRVTHVVSPSEFYIRPILEDDCSCICAHGKGIVTETDDDKTAECKKKSGALNLRRPFGGSGQLQELSQAPSTCLEEDLQEFLQPFTSHMFREDRVYFPNTELVAVRIGLQWRRAIVLHSGNAVGKVRVQLLDSGEKLTVGKYAVCRLPGRFCDAAKAFRCCLFGVSPVWYTWSSIAARAFQELVQEKDVVVVVKDTVRPDHHGEFAVFESRPYLVNVLTSSASSGSSEMEIDVGEQLLKMQVALKWSSTISEFEGK